MINATKIINLEKLYLGKYTAKLVKILSFQLFKCELD